MTGTTSVGAVCQEPVEIALHRTPSDAVGAYRLIFLLVAEDRNLLHPPSATAAARKLYAEGYSLGSLRDRAVRRAAWDRHHDRWGRSADHFRGAGARRAAAWSAGA